MRTKEDFVSRWRHRLAGLALYGSCSERNDGPLQKVARVYEIPAEVERMLRSMYEDMTADETPPNGTPKPGPGQNGAHTTPRR